jgi:restriction system protein
MIPDYQSIMLPLLRVMEDGQERHISVVLNKIAEQLHLSADELNELLPSGRQTLFSNRVHWAKTYLAQARLLEITRRAYFRITERGRKVLQEKPTKIDVRLLERFPEFKEFKERARSSQTRGPPLANAEIAPSSEPTATQATPDELMRGTIADIEAALSRRW